MCHDDGATLSMFGRLSPVAFAVMLPALLRAQDDRPDRWQAEARGEVVGARTTAIHAGAGVNAIAGTYLRIGVLGAAGARHTGDAWRRSGRADVVARFHLDPMRQFSHGFYVAGGGSILFDDGVRGRARTIIALGIEGRASKGGWITGAELGLGGGARLALTLRRARDGAR